jgi:ribokinase
LSSRRAIVVVGSINMDMVAVTEEIPFPGQTVIGTDFQIHPGGKGANQAVAVARLGYPVEMIGRLGNDAFGAQLRSELNEVGVDTAGVATTEGSSGVALIVVSSAGENSIVVASGSNARVTTQDLDANIERIRQAGMVLAQLEIPLETIEYLAYLCAREKIPFILDPAPASDLPSSIFKHIAWFTPNQTEAALYTRTDGRVLADPGEAAATILANGCHGVVLKMGSRGAYLASQAGIGELVPAFAVKAIDTTAAGDAFNGGFATGLMLGKSPAESAIFASAVAAISVTRTGAQPSMPRMIEVEEFIKNGSARRGDE